MVAAPSRFVPAQQVLLHEVRGVVANSEGLKMEGACVLALQLNHASAAGNLACQPTDPNGEFKLRLPPGKYVIRAKDEAEGYPDPNFLFSADSRANFPEIVVGTSDILGLRVTLGPRGGVLEGDVLDGATGLAIGGAKITISDAKAPAFVEVFSNKRGHFQFTVPRKAVSVCAVAPGYRSSRAEELLLSGGQRQSVRFELQQK